MKVRYFLCTKKYFLVGKLCKRMYSFAEFFYEQLLLAYLQ